MDESLGDQLRRLRKTARITQPGLEELTRALPGRIRDGDRRVSQGHIAMIETGQRGASQETIDSIADALELDEATREGLYAAARLHRDRLIHGRVVRQDGIVVDVSGTDSALVGRMQAIALSDLEVAAMSAQLTDEGVQRLKEFAKQLLDEQQREPKASAKKPPPKSQRRNRHTD